MCYNISTYKLPPLALGGFEPPRQLANGCQDRYVCQFQHSAISENQGGGSSLPANPLSNPLNLIVKQVFYFVKCKTINLYLFLGINL